ncbi:MAG: hypothetical protein EXQ96_05680 [Alphaproteobacteria bacterium]|nr:hypothetical protein [Alphaproteobacteria bacterium]
MTAAGAGRPRADLTVGTILRDAAAATPDRVALDDGRRCIGYGALDRAVDTFASGLLTLGVGRGEVVAALLPNSIAYVVVVLAVARAGAVFSPLNPRYKAFEIRRLLAAARPRVVVTGADRAEMLLAALGDAGVAGCRVVVTEGDAAPEGCLPWDAAQGSPGAPLPLVEEDEPFSLIFTSGTTGAPKGAVGSHRARMLWVLKSAVVYGLSEADSYLGTMPLVHSAGLTFTLMHLYAGARVRILESFDPAAYLAIVRAEGITSSLTVPTMLAMIMERHAAEGADQRLASLRRLITCGSPLTPQLKQAVLSRLTPELFDYYGSTESNSMSVLKPRDQLRKSRSVGQAFPGVRFQILDSDGRSLAAGEVGEIWCDNPSAMLRYHNLPAETAAVFRGSIIDTGDLGFLDADGFLHLVGRSKEVIITGGVNVYPAEIEEIVMLHGAVSDCAVVGVADAKWGQAIAAFVVLRAGHALDLAALQAHCRTYLADFKQPRHLTIVQALPKTASGKTVKSVLAATPI